MKNLEKENKEFKRIEKLINNFLTYFNNLEEIAYDFCNEDIDYIKEELGMWENINEIIELIKSIPKLKQKITKLENKLKKK